MNLVKDHYEILVVGALLSCMALGIAAWRSGMFHFYPKHGLTKNQGKYKTIGEKTTPAKRAPPNLHSFPMIPTKNITDKVLASNTTLKAYNLEEINNISKFLIKNLCILYRFLEETWLVVKERVKEKVVKN